MTGFIFDIDGVITDGTVTVDYEGNELKKYNLKDADAIYELHKEGFFLGAVTAEKNSFSEYIKCKFPWNVFYEGVENKGLLLNEIRDMGCSKIIYIGDGKKDISAFEEADVRICPKDAISDLKDKADYILGKESGKGGLWEIVDIIRGRDHIKVEDAATEWNRLLDEHLQIMQVVKCDFEYQELIVKSAEMITDAILNNHRVVIFGNGGSAADAQHIAAEYISRFEMERRALDMEALTVNTSVLTAIGNDYSYENIFARQIEGMTKAGDVAIGISTSGTSKNVRKALDIAREKNVKTIFLTGNLKEQTSYNVTLRVKSNSTARVQEIHILTGHYWAGYTEKCMRKNCCE